MRAHSAVTVAVVLALAAAAPSPARARGTAPDGNVFRCESADGRTRECAADGRDIRLIRQLSHSACVEGDTWGRSRAGVWVSGGCRAEFVAIDRGRYDRYGDDGGSRHDAGMQTIRCGSQDGRWNHCDADTRRGVQLVRQLSRAQCIRGDSWGYDARGVWVNGGCRAEFAIADAGRTGMQPSSGRFRCESGDGSPRSCAADPRGGVRLVKQLSHSPCIEGRTWGVQRGGVWVAEGCRAEFETGGQWADGRW